MKNKMISSARNLARNLFLPGLILVTSGYIGYIGAYELEKLIGRNKAETRKGAVGLADSIETKCVEGRITKASYLKDEAEDVVAGRIGIAYQGREIFYHIPFNNTVESKRFIKRIKTNDFARFYGSNEPLPKGIEGILFMNQIDFFMSENLLDYLLKELQDRQKNDEKKDWI